MNATSIPKLGIIGGGQLARMLAFSAHRLGIPCYVLSPRRDDAAAEVVKHHICADIHDQDALQKLMTHCTVITFESENITENTLELLAQSSCSCLPHPLTAMQPLARRHSQKKLLASYNLPITPYLDVTQQQQGGESLVRYIKERLSLPAVLKTSKGGYDGRATFIIHPQKPDHLDLLTAFLSKYAMIPLIAEKYVDFSKEIAITMARNARGDIHTLPAVETYQKDYQCDWVKGPLETKKELKDHLSKLKTAITHMLHHIQYIGVITFELFVLHDQSVWINEVAPRVHNSAHYSMNALDISQFDLHIMSLFNMPLPIDYRLRSPGFAMTNLIGKGEHHMPLIQNSDTFLHRYDKKEARRGRKMGHINALAPSTEEALKKALTAREDLYKHLRIQNDINLLYT
ncbi:MAG: 5-(carboxyamino)imidazole ribonucleotide synthase [Proteobacteria bacterium]|nr:5-(carboxyamino)imidazole ribonucleotide synthase [Pseudomonadota bacterium]